MNVREFDTIHSGTKSSVVCHFFPGRWFSTKLLFYCPRAVWLSLEGSLMKHLASSECRSKVVEEVEEKVDTLVDTFTVHLRNKYNRYFFAFLGCEILNLVMVVTQVIIKY